MESPNSRRLLALLVFVYILHAIDRQIIAVLLEPLKDEFQLSDSQLGLLSGLAYSGAATIFGIPAGILADRFSRKAVLLAALSVWSGCTALCGAASSYSTLLLARMGVGAAESGAPPASLSMLADAFPLERRAGAVGIFYASGGIGVILSFTVGAWIAANFGWRIAFFVAGAPGLLLVAILAFVLVEPTRETASKSPERGGLFSAVSEILGNPPLALLISAMAFASLSPSVLFIWMASLLIREHGYALTNAGLVVAISAGIFGPLGQMVGGRLGDRLVARRSGLQVRFAAISCLAGACFGIMTVLIATSHHMIIGLALTAFAMFLFIGPAYGLLMELSPARSRSTIIAIVTVSSNLVAFGLGPAIVGVLSDAIGGDYSLSKAMSLAFCVSLLPATLFAILAKRMTPAAS